MGGMTLALEARPLAEWFRRVDLWLEADPTGDDFATPTARIAAWLQELDALHRASLAAAPGPRGNQHLLYDRMVTLRTPVAPLRVRPLIVLGRACIDCGVGFTAPITLDGGRDEAAAVAALAEAGAISRLVVHLPCAEVGATWLESVERLARAGIRLVFAGPFARFRALGITASDVLSARAHHYLPAGDTSTAAAAVAGCGRRFSVNVAADGAIYPCRGLMGLPDATLGHIDEAPGPDFLHTTRLELQSLAARGPTDCDGIWAADAVARRPDLPPICARHRAALQAEVRELD